MQPYHKLLLFLLLGGQSGHGAKIIDGNNVPDHLMLHMASLWNSKEHICGGFLVSDDFVLTAAHCESVLSVILGTHHLSSASNDMKYNVAKKCKHPSFVETSKGNDIMLLKLSRKAQGPNVKVIDLPKHPVGSSVNQYCVVAGWGYVVNRGQPVNDLKKTSVKIISLTECKRKWGALLPHSTICAGGFNTSKGFCQCDSGGPLVCKGVPVGIVSFNRNAECTYPSNFPNVYTDIYEFLPWINGILNSGDC
ncbi:duodenase-1-like [Eucyclogobius newberryi]|uniref:duodenase-1-like n=1 Tax=Eucyclogobius newberryi TaxID=166745 RepID=UPI003B5CCF14